MVIKKKQPEKANVRLDDSDWSLVEALKTKLGLKDVSNVLRQALRALAAKEGVTL